MFGHHEEKTFLASFLDSKRNNWLIIWIILCALISWSFVEASTRDSLDSFLYEYTFNNIIFRPRTGQLYKVSLPRNLSGMEVSIIRLRTHRLWNNGTNLSSIEIPPKILPRPFTRRVDIVYQNLGNWSRIYYNVPNYTLIAPVIGLLAYDSSTSSSTPEPIDLNTNDDNPIIIRFVNISLSEGMKCVTFGTNGTLEFTNVSQRSCVATGRGHFSIVVPYRRRKEDEKKIWIASGIVGLVILILVLGIVGNKFVKWEKMKKMEKLSEISEGLDTIWIGNSRMPSASGIRTQPVLENTYVP